MKLKTKIENILCLVDFKQELFIDEFSARCHGLKPMKNLSGYLFSPFQGSEMNFMIFPSGKVLLNGLTSEKELEKCFWVLMNKIRKIKPVVEIKPNIEIKIQNVMVSANLAEYFQEKNFTINLKKLARKEKADYDPKKFPAVFLKFFSSPEEIGKVPLLGTAIVFSSGKILIGDVKSKEDAAIILEKVIERVK